jgi:hypothetical protein
MLAMFLLSCLNKRRTNLQITLHIKHIKMVELGTHNLCPLTNEVEECIWGDRVFKTGIMRSRSYKSVLALLHITRTAFWYGWQHRRSFP